MEQKRRQTPAGKNKAGFREELDAVLRDVSRIEDETYCIRTKKNPDFDAWDEDSPEYLYEDPQGIIGGILERGCAMVRRCLEREDFSQGLSLGRRLLNLGAVCIGDQSDWELTVVDLQELGMAEVDVEELLHDTLCCAFLCAAPVDRPRAIRLVLTDALDLDPNLFTPLEVILQECEPDERERIDFARHWTDFLTDFVDELSREQIPEVMELFPDAESFCLGTAEYASRNHILYAMILQCLRDFSDRELARSGVDILQKLEDVRTVYPDRCTLAVKTAQAMISTGNLDQERLDTCDRIAFRTVPIPENYLRALCNASDPERMKRDLHEVLVDDEQTLFSLPHWEVLDFARLRHPVDVYPLDDPFPSFTDRILESEHPGDWRQGYSLLFTSLFLLCFYQEAGDHEENPERDASVASFPPGIRRALHCARTLLHFDVFWRRGMLMLQGCVDERSGEVSEEEKLFLLWRILCRWREALALTKEQQEKTLQQLAEIIRRRTADVLHRGERSSYEDCCSLIAALSEVLQSRGQGTKQQFMDAYRESYPRHWAFLAQMERYGWERKPKKR